MLHFESVFYGIKALIYGLPLSFLVMMLIYDTLMEEFEFAFMDMVPWVSIGIVIIAVFYDCWFCNALFW